MAPDAPTPLPVRPSEVERERVARLLRESSVAGRISIDTFSDRLEATFDARQRGELDDLVADILHPGPLRRVLAALRLGSGSPQLPALALPDRSRATVVFGRSRDCDCVLTEPTVSRRHAELRHDGSHWLLRDLASLNGTRVNGLRLLEETEVRPGDRVSFGEERLRLVAPRPGSA